MPFEREMEEYAFLSIFEQAGAIVEDIHVVYAFGRHGRVYINKDALYPHTIETGILCRALAAKFKDDGVETVIGPATGGILLSHGVAHRLTELYGNTQVFAIYADKEVEDIGVVIPPEAGRIKFNVKEERFRIGRGYEKFIIGKRVLVVEDILTTGRSARLVVEATRSLGGTVVGLGVLCNRGGLTAEDFKGVPKLVSLVTLALESWDEADCPLCRDKVAVNAEFGRGRQFLARKSS